MLETLIMHILHRHVAEHAADSSWPGYHAAGPNQRPHFDTTLDGMSHSMMLFYRAGTARCPEIAPRQWLTRHAASDGGMHACQTRDVRDKSRRTDVKLLLCRDSGRHRQ